MTRTTCARSHSPPTYFHKYGDMEDGSGTHSKACHRHMEKNTTENEKHNNLGPSRASPSQHQFTHVGAKQSIHS